MLRILLVEDSVFDRKSLGKAFTDSGIKYMITEFSKAEEAFIDIIRHHDKYDVIISDYLLPGMNGLEFLLSVLKENIRVPLILITGEGSEHLAASAIKSGISEYVVKDIDLRYLSVLPVTVEKAVSNFNNWKARQKAEEDLFKSEKELREANIKLALSLDAKNKFLRIFSHDLKAPVGNSKTLSDMLYNDYDNISETEKKDIISLLKQSNDATLKLLENLMSWSKSQSSTMIYRPRFFDVSSTIVDVIELQIAEISKKELSVKSSVEKGALVYADEEMISTVLRNLLSNAVKYTPKKGNISFEGYHKNDTLFVEIRDSGIGIENDHLKNIFDIEYAHSTKGTEDETGNGIGLLICKELLEKNCGSLSVESTVGVGSTFILSLPMKEVSCQI